MSNYKAHIQTRGSRALTFGNNHQDATITKEYRNISPHNRRPKQRTDGTKEARREKQNQTQNMFEN